MYTYPHWVSFSGVPGPSDFVYKDKNVYMKVVLAFCFYSMGLRRLVIPCIYDGRVWWMVAVMSLEVTEGFIWDFFVRAAKWRIMGWRVPFGLKVL